MPATEPAVVPVTEPAVVPATQPAVVPATEPAIVPVTEPAVVPATIPAVVPATEPVIVPATEPAVVPTCRILTNMEDIEIEFAKMTIEVEKALNRAEVDVASLIKELSAMNIVKSKQVPLFGGDMFKEVQSIDGLWRKLKDYWHIFDYDVLECVIKLSGCREAQKILEDFKSRIDPSAIKKADLVLWCTKEDWKGYLKPVLRIKVNTEVKDECTPEVEDKVKEVVSKTFDLERHKLHLKGIKEGCTEMVYCISKPLKFYFLNFAITESNMAEFLAHDIISLHIDDTDDEYELKVPSKIADVVSCMA